MKKCFLFFLFVFLVSQKLFPDSSPFYHRDILIRAGTEASLDQLVLPVLKKNSADKSFQLFSINHLYLAEGTKLIVREPSEIGAIKITLMPKSGIYSLGQPIRIRSERFKALHCSEMSGQGGHSVTLLTIQEKKGCMGKIDTTLSAGEDGSEGAVSLEGAPPKFDYEHPSSNSADKGDKGAKGGRGGDGKDAGSIFLQVKHFEGGHFCAAGSHGGEGGPGGRGAKGGSGLKDLSRSRNYANALSDSGTNRFINGGKGGIGGEGGDGGNGGSGGAVQILFETKSDDAEEMLVIENQRGERGEVGAPGKGGEGGDAGQVWTSRDKAGNWGYIVGEQGDVGHDCTIYGKGGEQGVNGPPPKLEYRKYVQQE